MKLISNLHAFIWQSTSGNNANTYLIDGPTRILIDPGHKTFFNHVEHHLEALGLGMDDIGLIVCTHAHPDHMEAVQLFSGRPALVALHLQEWQFLKTVDQRIRAALKLDPKALAPHFFIQEGDLAVNGLDFQILHTPGHSPGSVSLYWPQEKALITGDVVFKAGFGRTDLPGGNRNLLKKSIQRLARLDIEWLLPGHGDIIAGADQVKSNFERLLRR